VKGWNAHGRTLASISDPAALIFVLEGWNNMCPEVRWAIDENLDCSVHNKGSTYIFADGHARWMRVAQTLDPVNMWADDAFAPSARQTIYNNHWSLLLAGAKKSPRLRDCLE
jgi:prepilin-type processing-associated H-X9-DG protein